MKLSLPRLLFGLLLLVPALVRAQAPSRESELDAVINAMENNQSVKDRKVSLRILQFEIGTDRLTPGDQKYLDSMAVALAKIPTVTLEISGHTDNTGSAKRNYKLSQARANRVRGYLIGKGTVARRIRAVGYGSSQPLTTNDTPEGRGMNRRVELKFQGLTNDVYTLVTKGGKKIPTTYLVVSKDGKTLSYRETANGPVSKLSAGSVDYLIMPDGSRMTMSRFTSGGSGGAENPVEPLSPEPAPTSVTPVDTLYIAAKKALPIGVVLYGEGLFALEGLSKTWVNPDEGIGIRQGFGAGVVVSYYLRPRLALLFQGGYAQWQVERRYMTTERVVVFTNDQKLTRVLAQVGIRLYALRSVYLQPMAGGQLFKLTSQNSATHPEGQQPTKASKFLATFGGSIGFEKRVNKLVFDVAAQYQFSPNSGFGAASDPLHYVGLRLGVGLRPQVD